MTPQQIEQMRTAFYQECCEETDGQQLIRCEANSGDVVFDWFISHIPEKEWPTDGKKNCIEFVKWVDQHYCKGANGYIEYGWSYFTSGYSIEFLYDKWIKDYMTK